MPKVSVIIPVYGVEKYIERCARTLFEQTLEEIEFIFIDDCTPDRSMELLGKIIDEYRSRIAGMNWVVRTEKMPANSGLPAVRRHGIELAKGDYIINCDSDDWVDLDLYEKMYEASQNGEFDIVVSGYKMTDGIHEKLFKELGSSDADMYLQEMMNGRTAWFLSNKLIKSWLWRKIAKWPTGNMGEDMCISLQLFSYAKNVAFVSGPVYYYYANPVSIARAHSEQKDIAKYKQLSENVEIVINFLKNKSYNKAFQKSIDHLHFCRYSMLVNVKDTEYRKEYRRGVRLYAWSVITNSNVMPKDRIRAFLMLTNVYQLLTRCRV